jgi:NADPH:quinone reductase
MKTHAFRLTAVGAPDVLQWQEIDLAEPGRGEVQVRHTAVGFNYIDTLQRRGLYPIQIPGGLGVEAAGIVEAVGPDVSEVKAGDRVVYAGGPLGAYAERRVISASVLVKIPDGVSDQQAAAMLLQGMTARFLLRKTYEVQAGETILVHAAAGGVGSILCQWAKALGATIIGTVSTKEKVATAERNGCDHTIVYTQEDFVARVGEITNGKKVPVVYDSVGKDTFVKSFGCLQPFGTLVLYGQSSGIVDPLETRILTERGSLYLTRPALWHHIATRDALLESAQDLFDIVASGAVKISVNQTYPLHQAAQAHRDAEARRTTGSTVFTV